MLLSIVADKNYNNMVDLLLKKINIQHIATGCRHQMEISSLDCNNEEEDFVSFMDVFLCKNEYTIYSYT